MNLNKRRAIGVVVLGFGALALAVRLTRPRRATLPPRPRVPAAEFVHPIMPSTPVVHPEPPTCRSRDLRDVTLALRRSEKRIAEEVGKHGAKQGAPASCRAAADDQARIAEIDLLTRITTGCVARDATLDSQWNQVQSAAAALDACADCTRPRAARSGSCGRVVELLDAAEKATPL
jgi:hypothetical protein